MLLVTSWPCSSSSPVTPQETANGNPCSPVLKGCKMLAMSVCSMGRIPGGYITNHMYSWVDPHGQSVSPPPDSQEAIQRKGHSMEERTVRTMCVYVYGGGGTKERFRQLW
ncbi:whirlin-like [Micropterus dolomieu]|uniref:whirlin-like n=1 Tax=Micropterus dolomieu TaxID=147949 RepID=UPI001E8D189A|nr:whirlin-like [Micropterus dolomieu]